MLALARRYHARGLRMLAVTQDEDVQALADFLAEAGISGEEILVLRDPRAELSKAYGTRLLPETYMIDRAGNVVARFMGPRDWGSEASLRLVERLLSSGST